VLSKQNMRGQRVRLQGIGLLSVRRGGRSTRKRGPIMANGMCPTGVNGAVLHHASPALKQMEVGLGY